MGAVQIPLGRLLSNPARSISASAASKHAHLQRLQFSQLPRTSMYEASERDFRLVLAQDAMSGLYERGLQELRGIGVTIAPTDQICREFLS